MDAFKESILNNYSNKQLLKWKRNWVLSGQNFIQLEFMVKKSNWVLLESCLQLIIMVHWNFRKLVLVVIFIKVITMDLNNCSYILNLMKWWPIVNLQSYRSGSRRSRRQTLAILYFLFSQKIIGIAIVEHKRKSRKKKNLYLIIIQVNNYIKISLKWRNKIRNSILYSREISIDLLF